MERFTITKCIICYAYLEMLCVLPMIQTSSSWNLNMTRVSAQERGGAWVKLAEENGWSTDTPTKSSLEIKGQVINQYVMIVISGMVGVVMLLIWFFSRRLWIEGDETHFNNSRGKTVFLDELQSIDVSRWEEKGIAVLRFSGEKGKAKFVLDDFKFNQEVTDQLFEIAREILYGMQSGG